MLYSLVFTLCDFHNLDDEISQSETLESHPLDTPSGHKTINLKVQRSPLSPFQSSFHNSKAELESFLDSQLNWVLKKTNTPDGESSIDKYFHHSVGGKEGVVLIRWETDDYLRSLQRTSLTSLVAAATKRERRVLLTALFSPPPPRFPTPPSLLRQVNEIKYFVGMTLVRFESHTYRRIV